jgi:hypothetical protein
LSAGSKAKFAPNWSNRERFSSLRDNATTIDPVDFPSCTAAVPTPPDAPVISSTDPAGEVRGLAPLRQSLPCSQIDERRTSHFLQ